MLYNAPYDQLPGNPNASYLDGNPGIGQQGSIIPAAAMEYPQREIVNVLTDNGLTPSNSDLDQLSKAIQLDIVNWVTDTNATAGTITITPSPLPPSLVAGLKFLVKVKNTNLGSVTSATVAAGGTGGTAGTQTVTVSGGTGTACQLSVTVSGGAMRNMPKPPRTTDVIMPSRRHSPATRCASSGSGCLLRRSFTRSRPSSRPRPRTSPMQS